MSDNNEAELDAEIQQAIKARKRHAEHESFRLWVRGQTKNRNKIVGDLAADAVSDETFPATNDLDELTTYLAMNNACDGALEALKIGHRLWKAWVKREAEKCPLCERLDAGRELHAAVLEVTRFLVSLNPGKDTPGAALLDGLSRAVEKYEKRVFRV